MRDLVLGPPKIKKRLELQKILPFVDKKLIFYCSWILVVSFGVSEILLKFM